MQKEVFMAPDGTLPPPPSSIITLFWLHRIGYDMCGMLMLARGMQKDGFMGAAARTWPPSSIRFKATRSSPVSPDGTKPSSVALLAGLNWRAWGGYIVHTAVLLSR